MKREDMTVSALFLELLVLLMAFVYVGLQIFYGINYHVGAQKVLLNVFAMVLVYVGLTVLCIYPERINRLPEEVFTPYIRKLSIRMVRLIKAIFVAGLLVPCAFDAVGIEMKDANCLVVIGLILLTAIFYEYKIIHILRKS